jgi:hypothetical protein
VFDRLDCVEWLLYSHLDKCRSLLGVFQTIFGDRASSSIATSGRFDRWFVIRDGSLVVTIRNLVLFDSDRRDGSPSGQGDW